MNPGGGPWWVLTCPRGQGRNGVGWRELCPSDLANPLLVPPLGLSLPARGVEVGQMGPHFHVRCFCDTGAGQGICRG